MEFNRARILAPARTFLERMILIALLVVAVGALVVGRLTVRMTRPLYALAYAADEVAAGDLTGRVTATSENEIGRVGRAFNEMVAGITLARRQLETQVVERDRALDALRESEAHYRAIIEVALDCVIAIDATGRVLEFNPAAEKTFGFRKADVVGRELADFLVPPAFRQAHRDGLARNAASGGGALIGQRVEMPALRADGTEVQIELADQRRAVGRAAHLDRRRPRHHRTQAGRGGAPAEPGDGGTEPPHPRGQPVEERVPGQHVARAAHAAQRDHRVRRADAQRQGRARRRRSTRNISATSSRARGTCCSSSTTCSTSPRSSPARWSSGRSRSTLGKLVARGARHPARPRGRASGCRVEIAGRSRQLATSSLDPARVKQMLYNYLSNAIKFTPEGGRVDVRVAPDGDRRASASTWRTRASASRPRSCGRLFVEFQQLDSGTAKRYQGTGLGLALTKRLVEAQGGRVEVRSSPGRAARSRPSSAHGDETGARRRPDVQRRPVGQSHGARHRRRPMAR